MALNQPMATVRATMTQRRSLSRSPVAAGTMSSATTRMAPTESNAVTAVTATAMSTRRETSAEEIPMVRENSGSNVVTLSSFHPPRSRLDHLGRGGKRGLHHGRGQAAGRHAQLGLRDAAQAGRPGLVELEPYRGVRA